MSERSIGAEGSTGEVSRQKGKRGHVHADVARKFGIRSAMPGFIGRRLCPELVFVKPDFSKYVKVAAATRAIFVDYDPDFEAGSLDEAYLDVTDYCQMHTTTGVCEVLQGRVYAMPTLSMCPVQMPLCLL